MGCYDRLFFGSIGKLSPGSVGAMFEGEPVVTAFIHQSYWLGSRVLSQLTKASGSCIRKKLRQY